jgi:hypothetical protein
LLCARGAAGACIHDLHHALEQAGHLGPGVCMCGGACAADKQQRECEDIGVLLAARALCKIALLRSPADASAADGWLSSCGLACSPVTWPVCAVCCSSCALVTSSCSNSKMRRDRDVRGGRGAAGAGACCAAGDAHGGAAGCAATTPGPVPRTSCAALPP